MIATGTSHGHRADTELVKKSIIASGMLTPVRIAKKTAVMKVNDTIAAAVEGVARVEIGKLIDISIAVAVARREAASLQRRDRSTTGALPARRVTRVETVGDHLHRNINIVRSIKLTNTFPNEAALVVALHLLKVTKTLSLTPILTLQAAIIAIERAKPLELTPIKAILKKKSSSKSRNRKDVSASQKPVFSPTLS
jgi:hypothetical protein